METLLKIIKPYNLFTTLYPGYLFAVFCDETIQSNIINVHEKSVLLGICFCYFIGSLINRVGSLVIENIMRKIIDFVEYDDYVEASKQDGKIDMLSQTNNTYRSLSALFLVLTIIKMLPECIMTVFYNWFDFIVFVIYVMAYGKQTNYVIKRVNSVLRKR